MLKWNSLDSFTTSSNLIHIRYDFIFTIYYDFLYSYSNLL